MNTEFILIAGFAVIVAVLAVYLKQYNKEYGLLVALSGGILIFIFLIKQLVKIIDFADKLMRAANIASEDFALLVKILGLAYIVQLSCDLCRDSGETALASKVETAGKVTILFTALPLFQKLLELIIQAIK